MAEFTINLKAPLNESVQAGDIAYFVKTSTLAEFEINNGQPIKIGKIKKITLTDSNDDGAIDNAALLCSILANAPEPIIGDFIFFSKDNRVNQSGLLGYYGEFSLINNSKERAELFTVACEVVGSS